MEAITLEDFEEGEVEGHPVKYLKYDDGTVQICLEPCAGGMCVGIYDQENWILAEKLCTNMPNHAKEMVLKQAVFLANKIYSDWKIKNVIE